MRWVHALNALLVVELIGLSLWVYPALPDPIPIHFAANGMPDGWVRKSLLAWMMMPLVGLGTAGLMYGIARWMPTRPQSFNMPGKKKFLELPPHLQRWVIQSTMDLLYLTALLMLVIFSVAQYSIWESAHTGGASRWMLPILILTLVAAPFMTIGFLVTASNRLDRAWRAYQRDGAGAAVP